VFNMFGSFLSSLYMSWIKRICLGPCNVSVIILCITVRKKETEKAGRKYANFKVVIGAPFVSMNRRKLLQF
jgi:hypothetical protein